MSLSVAFACSKFRVRENVDNELWEVRRHDACTLAVFAVASELSENVHTELLKLHAQQPALRAVLGGEGLRVHFR